MKARPQEPARAPKASIAVEVTPATEPMDDLDRWAQQYAESVARLEGIPTPTRSESAA